MSLTNPSRPAGLRLRLEEIRPAPMDIDRLLEEVRRVMAQSADQQGLPLTIERDPSLPRVVLCDPVRLKQILLNLLSSEMPAMP